MNCPLCQTQMVKAQATNFGEEYDYCRACRKEYKEMVAPPSTLSASANLNVEAIEAAVQTAWAHAMVYSPPQVGFSCTYGGTIHQWSVSQDRCQGCGLTAIDLYHNPAYSQHTKI